MATVHAIAFDTLLYSKKLIAAGFTSAQAEVQAETLAEVLEDQLATKRDLQEMENSLKRDIKEMEMRMTIRLGTMLTATVAVVGVLVKLF
jgi:hypothetical protein